MSSARTHAQSPVGYGAAPLSWSLEDYRFFPIMEIKSETEATVHSFLAVLEPSLAIGDNLPAVWYVRDPVNQSWTGYTWTGASITNIAYSVQTILNQSAPCNTKWSRATQWPELNVPETGNTFVSPVGYNRGFVANNPIESAINSSPHRDLIVDALKEFGYPVANLKLDSVTYGGLGYTALDEIASQVNAVFSPVILSEPTVVFEAALAALVAQPIMLPEAPGTPASWFPQLPPYGPELNYATCSEVTFVSTPIWTRCIPGTVDGRGDPLCTEQGAVMARYRQQCETKYRLTKVRICINELGVVTSSSTTTEYFSEVIGRSCASCIAGPGFPSRPVPTGTTPPCVLVRHRNTDHQSTPTEDPNATPFLPGPYSPALPWNTPWFNETIDGIRWWLFLS